MFFHSWPFLIFFAVFYVVYLATRTTAFRIPWLLISSYVFYGWWDPLYLLLIVYSTLIDYVAVLMMDRGRRRRVWLAVSVLNNLALLGTFKYAGFLVSNLNEILGSFGAPFAIQDPGVLLPVGISFYTFQSMSYTIDYYRGKIAAERNLLRFAAYVSLFPQLVAGPIERAASLLPQLARAPRIAWHDVTDGLSLFTLGLFKKVALANYLALYVDRVYAAPQSQSAAALLVATFFFAWQIYFDFSGYTDMARGIARAMGIDLMLNFNKPYLATDLGDFWRRWHISLSTWFRDYVYIPLGGNRGDAARTYFNIFLTMVISGVWHGASWTFVVWGALHGLGRLFTLALEKSTWYRDRVPCFVKRALVFAFVCLTWIFFRADSISEAWMILGRLFTAGFSDPRFPLLALLMILTVWTYQTVHESRLRHLVELAPVKVAIVTYMLIHLAVAPPTGDQAFIYFQF